MNPSRSPFKFICDRAFATVLLVVLPFAAGLGASNAPPPPPRFVPVHSDVHVIATWSADGPHGSSSLPASASAQAGDTSLLSKAASAASVVPDGTLHYAVTVTNATPAGQTFRLTDTLPIGVSYVTGTASGGFVYDAAATRLTAAFALNAFHGDVVSVSGAPTYTEISGSGQDICAHYFAQCDDDAITLGGVPFRFLGVDYTTATLSSNGFIIPGSVDPRPGSQNQNLPDPVMPNNVIAPFWDDLDLHGNSLADPGGGDWFYGVEHDSGANADYLVVEWHNAQKKATGGTSYSFQVWIQLRAEHITFAYQDLTGTASSASIGFENSNGTLGHSYLFDGAGSVPLPGTQLQVAGVYDTATLGYDVKAGHGLPGCSAINNVVDLSNVLNTLTASAAAVTPVFGPCQFLPLVRR